MRHTHAPVTGTLIVGALLAAVVAGPSAAAQSAKGSRAHPTFVFVGDERVYSARVDAPADRSLVRRLRPLDSVQSATVSPDGRMIALTAWTDRDGTPCSAICLRVGVMRRDGSHLKWLVSQPWGRTGGWPGPPVVWSPNGRTLYFSQLTTQAVAQGGYLMAIDLDATNPRPRRVLGGSGLTQPSASPDGTKLAAIRPHLHSLLGSGSSRRTELVTLDLATGLVSRPLLSVGRGAVPVPLQQPAWSPDGSRIAVVHATGGYESHLTSEIVVVPARGGSSLPRTVATGGTEYQLSWPAWRNGLELWFTRNYQSSATDYGYPPSRQGDLFGVTVTSTEVGKPVRLTRTEVTETSASFPLLSR